MSGYYEDDPDDGGEEAQPSGEENSAMSILALYGQTPDSMKGLRACKRCGMIRSLAQFYDEGCPNCPFLEMLEARAAVGECTTAFFEGTVAITDARSSWAARWLHVDGLVPGVYAILVTGSFGPAYEGELVSRGLRWRCRPPGATGPMG
mmetsp:Transcript_6897/g.14362  ORF Transcript_6897/g.14362 Transcript_6897/m.14362 type:complete len:149 (+) Transcript_6897:113-559(+)